MGDEDARDSSEELAAWLKDAGRRTWTTDQPPRADGSSDPAEPPAAIVKHLEQLAGRKFHCKDDVRRYIAEASGRNPAAAENARARQLLRHTLLLLALLIAYMQYNFLDVSLQIGRLPGTIIFVPVGAKNASISRSFSPA